MHQCWPRLTAGCFETRYSYTSDLTYNTFIWLQIDEGKHKDLWDLGNAVQMRSEHYCITDLGKPYSDLPAGLQAMHRA